MRYLGFGMIFLGSFFWGVLKEKQQRDYCRNLADLRELFGLLRGALRSNGLPLPEAFLWVSDQMPDPWSLCLKNMAGECGACSTGKLEKIWEEQMGSAAKKKLYGEDVEALKRVGSQIGCLDFLQQEEVLLQMERHWAYREEKMRKAADEAGKVYRSIGICCGLFLIILLI